MSMTIRPTAMVRFNQTDLDVYILGGLRWLRMAQICASLQVVEKTAKRIFHQHQAEFSDEETGVIKVPTPGGPQMTRVFSPKGAARLAMLSKSPFGAQFRDAVLNTLEGQGEDESSVEAATDIPAGVLEDLRILFMGAKHNARLIRYLGMGLGTMEISRLLEIRHNGVTRKRRVAEYLGLVEPPAYLEERRARGGFVKFLEARKQATERYRLKQARLAAPAGETTDGE